MLKVLGRKTSINVRKVLWTAGELGLHYVQEDWGMPLRDPNVPGFLALNPNAQVPVIVDDDFVLHESSAIMRYLCERGGATTLLPVDIRQRALMEQWLSWQGTELAPSWGYAVYALLRKIPGYDNPERIAQSLARCGAKMQILEDQLQKTGAYVLGDTLTLADIALGLSVHRWLSLPADLPEFPAVSRYREQLREGPAGAEYLAAPYF